MEPIQLMIQDLGNQVAEKAVQVAEWKARALTAEATLEEYASVDEGEEEGEVAPVVSLVPEADEEDTDGS